MTLQVHVISEVIQKTAIFVGSSTEPGSGVAKITS